MSKELRSPVLLTTVISVMIVLVPPENAESVLWGRSWLDGTSKSGHGKADQGSAPDLSAPWRTA